MLLRWSIFQRTHFSRRGVSEPVLQVDGLKVLGQTHAYKVKFHMILLYENVDFFEIFEISKFFFAMLKKIIIFSELRKKLRYRFDAENCPLSISDVFRAIPALLHSFRMYYVILFRFFSPYYTKSCWLSIILWYALEISGS